MSPSPSELLRQLIRFRSENPPGNEKECIFFLKELLAETNCEISILAKDESRPNLIVRIKGNGSQSPLLMYGHVDVVPVEGQTWKHDPFGGELIDGYIWGRGALDMKGGIAMLVSAFIRIAENKIQLNGDLILVILSDEEAGGDFGAKFLVENHPEIFTGVKYAIGEFGGFSFHLGKKKFYPIMLAEKQVCWMTLKVTGQGGHGSIPVKKGAMTKASKILGMIDERQFPVHITPVVKNMIKQIARHLSFPKNILIRLLLFKPLTNIILRIFGKKGDVFKPILHNTVSATMLRGSSKINVIPSEVEISLDGRILPGLNKEQFINELKQLTSPVTFEITILRNEPGPKNSDSQLFPMLSEILKEMDPAGIPIPLLMSGVTDGRHFAKLGIQTYGFLPMQLPEDLHFTKLVHAADERIPADTLEFGTEGIYRAIVKYLANHIHTE